MITKRTLALAAMLCALCLPCRAPAEGTWTALSNRPPGQVGMMLLLPDGTVMADHSNPGLTTNIWYRLTPDIHGSYINGTWSTNVATSIHSRSVYGSCILRDGRLFVVGGEYGPGGSKAEIYNPTNNTWTDVSPPASLLDPSRGRNFLDSNSRILANGNVLITPVFANNSGDSLIYNPTTNGWSAGPTTYTGNYMDESSWVTLPDESILAVDPFGINSERYIPASNSWINDGTVPVYLYDPYAGEIGPAFLLPNGKAFYIGSTTNTAIYTPSGNTNPGTWTAGPVMTNSQGAALGAPDAPAAMMFNGKVLCALSPTPTAANHNPGPTYFYEYDYSVGPIGTFTQVHAPDGTFTIADDSQAQVMLDLPNGQVLMLAFYTDQLFVYTPDGSPLAAGKPAVRSVAINGDGTLHLTGTLFNGISEGASFGDECQNDSNYPLVRFIDGSGNVRYGRTYNWSHTGVMTGTNIVSTECAVPPGASLLDTFQVVANGIASDSTYVFPTALEAPAIPWSSGGTVGWRTETAVTHDGVDAAQSGVIGNSQSSYLETIVTGPGTLTFWWKVSSETNFDDLRFAIDGNVSNVISGEVNWQLVSIAVPAGNHTLRWTYAKDVSAAIGLDAGWVDQIGFALPLATALDTPSLTWNSGGHAVWAGEIATIHDSVDAAQSGSIGNNQNSYVETTVTGPGTLTFWWKVSSETNYDGLSFAMDGSVSNAISGEVDWQLITLGVPAGSHTLRWTYSKDGSLSGGVDAAWLDQVTYTLGQVANTDDSGAGSLRDTIAGMAAGSTVTFAPNLSGATITLASGELLLNKNLTVDASALPAGITVSGGNVSRAFRSTSGVTNALNRLRITGCVASGGPLNGYGGAIYIDGTLTLTNCTLTNNSASIAGAALYNHGALNLNNCTLAGNSAQYGGGIQNEGNLLANNSTLVNNTGSVQGGAISAPFGWPVLLNQCTLSANSSAEGGGIRISAGGVTIYNTIVAGNTAPSSPNIFGTFAVTGVNLTNGLPRLAPLGDYGGLTPTMLPMPNSPAINACTNSLGFAFDQRGLARLVGAKADIGAVEAGNPIPGFTGVVNVNNDEFDGPGTNSVSLREAIAFAPPGTTITFSENLSGSTIVLTNGELLLNKNLTIDAFGLASGIMINGNHASRVFEAGNGATNIVLDSLIITNGYDAGNGGGIYNISSASLTLINCTICGNATSAGDGGGAYFASPTSQLLANCTLSGNSSANGVAGGVYVAGSVNFSQCTLFQNTSASFGGGIFVDSGSAAGLAHCTIVSNTAPASQGGGVAVIEALNYTNCIITANSGADIFLSGVGRGDREGVNLIQSIQGTSSFPYTGNGTNLNVSPLLSPLGNYGGRTQTMPPLPGSPAIDGSTNGNPGFPDDQRGLPRNIGSIPDIGAVEANWPPTNVLVTVAGNDGPGSLRYAIAHYPVDSAITFANNLSGSTIMLAGGELMLNKNLTIDASSLPGGIVLNGNHNSRIIETAAGTTTVLTALTLTNGYVSGIGGAIYNGGNLTLNRCTLAGNTAAGAPPGAGQGGGIYNLNQLVTLNQCTLVGNSAQDSGGGIFSYSGVLNLANCTVYGNSAGSNYFGGGGGVINYAGTGTLTNSIIVGNTAPLNTNVGGIFSSANNLTNGNPLLAPFGNYGGPTWTMPPLAGSLAIDGGVATAFTIDQRGFTRVIGPSPDIGAVESGNAVSGFSPVVTVTGDVVNAIGVGGVSLRAAISFATNNTTVTFAPGLCGQTILLTNGQLIVNRSLAIDASALPGGITVSGNGASRAFYVRHSATTTLNRLTMTNCVAAGNPLNGYGGAIFIDGSLNLTDSTVANSFAATAGGGCLIRAGQGSAILNNCTLSQNSSPVGGGIQAEGPLTANNCTFWGNTGTNSGGAINVSFAPTVALNFCTLSGNSSALGGGLNLGANAALTTIYNSIIAGNTGGASSNFAGAFTASGANLTNGNPLLAALGNYGGPTRTMPPLSGSPAIDTGGATSFTTDQRGLVRVVGLAPDIGAVEFQIIATNPPAIAGLTRLGNGIVQFNFTNVTGANFSVLASTNPALPLSLWSRLGPVTESPASSGHFQFSDSQATNNTKRFYRVRSP